MRVDRTRDVAIFRKGDVVAVAVDPAMVTRGWVGGQGVQWFDTGSDEMAVTLSDGLSHGFMLYGSDEISDKFTSGTLQQPTYQYGMVGFGGWIVSVRVYETHTLASGRVTPIVYAPRDEVFFSLNGLLTTEDEWDVSADPRAPNTNVVGTVVQAPEASNNYYLTVQARL
jgi:hypothetical protein